MEGAEGMAEGEAAEVSSVSEREIVANRSMQVNNPTKALASSASVGGSTPSVVAASTRACNSSRSG